MSRIPRHFHFVFGLRPQTEEFHVVFYLCLESCFQVNRPERVTLYYHHEPHGPWWERIRGKLELVRVELSAKVNERLYMSSGMRAFSYAHHADFIRVEKVLEHGGVYADIDTLFVRPLPDALFEKSCVLGREIDLPARDGRPAAGSLCNALIMAEPGAAFLRRWLERMPGAFNGSWSEHACQLPHRLSLEHPEEIHVEPERSFYPYMWTRPDIRALLEERHEDWEGVYSVHLWNHLWWSPERHEFSEFNGARLTERFIRRGTTTYTLAARRFLPPASERGVVARLAGAARDLAREWWSRREECRRWLRARRRALRARFRG